MQKFLNNPVFICGHRKSGTTMISTLLDFHPELLTYPVDSGFFYAYYPRSEDQHWPTAKKIKRVTEFMIKNLEVEINGLREQDRKELKFSLAKFKKDFTAEAKKSPKDAKNILLDLFRAFYQNTPQNTSKIKAWVEKTTSTEIYAAEVAKWFPKAKFIHLLRDPRDNWVALRSGWDARYKNVNNASYLELLQSIFERGLLGMQMAIHNQQLLGKKRYLVIRYEDVVKNPKKYMLIICKFLGIKYDKALEVPTVLGKWWKGNNFDGWKFKSADPAEVGWYKKRLPKEEIDLIEYYYYDLMKHFGYTTQSTLNNRVMAAIKHYKWHNFSQEYSFKDSQITNYTKKFKNEKHYR